MLEVGSIAIDEVPPFTVRVQLMSSAKHGRQHGVFIFGQRRQSSHKAVPTYIERYHPRKGLGQRQK